MKKYFTALLLMITIFSVLPVLAQVAISSPDNEESVSMCINIPVKIQYQSKDYGVTNYVTLLQDFLYENKYLTSQPTGFFGAGTVKAVKAFQRANGISATGALGPNTRAKIASITGCTHIQVVSSQNTSSDNSSVLMSSGFVHSDYSYLDNTYTGDLMLSGTSYNDPAHVERLVQTVRGAGPNLKACTYVEGKAPCTEYVVLANQKGWSYNSLTDTYSIDLDVSKDGFPATTYVSLFVLADGSKREVHWTPRTSKNAALPEGCSSSSGYSNVNGQACVKPFIISNLSRATGYDYRSTLPLYYIGLKITGAGTGLKVCVSDPGVSCANNSLYIDVTKVVTSDTRYGTVTKGWKYDAVTDTYDSGYRNLYYPYTAGTGNYKYYFLLADGTKKSINVVTVTEPFKPYEVTASTTVTQAASITCAANEQVFSDSGHLRCVPKSSTSFGPN